MQTRPTTVSGIDMDNLMDSAFDNPQVETLQRLGVVSAFEPLPHSAFLKNKKTGVVLPYSDRLAQMRDIMENCDRFGNTDPAMWMPTVVQEGDYDPDLQAALLHSAIANINQAKNQTPAPVVNDPNERKMPYGAKPFDTFMSDRSAAVLDQLSITLA